MLSLQYMLILGKTEECFNKILSVFVIHYPSGKKLDILADSVCDSSCFVYVVVNSFLHYATIQFYDCTFESNCYLLFLSNCNFLLDWFVHIGLVFFCIWTFGQNLDLLMQWVALLSLKQYCELSRPLLADEAPGLGNEIVDNTEDVCVDRNVSLCRHLRSLDCNRDKWV